MQYNGGSPVETATDCILEDDSTSGWTRADWHAPPEVPAGPCQVIYVYDERVHPPRGESCFAHDRAPFAGLPRDLYAELVLHGAPVGVAGLLVGRDEALAASADCETASGWDVASSLSENSPWANAEDAYSDVGEPGDTAAAKSDLSLQPDSVDP